MQRWSIGLVAMALAVLAGCDNSPRTNTIYVATYGSYAALTDEALAGHDVPVFADFAPFEDDGALAARYARILKGDDPTLRFAAAGAGVPGLTDGVRVLLFHDPPGGYSGISACQGKPYDPAPSPEEMVLGAVVCDDDRRLVEVRGYLPRHEGDMKPDYDRLLIQTRPDMLAKEDRTPR